MNRLSSSLLLSVCLVSGSALASDPYPTIVARTTNAPGTPQCTLCHATLAGGSGTANKPFALALMSRGLTGSFNTSALQTALSRMRADQVDSDEDGTQDLAELTAWRNPNVARTATVDDCFGGTFNGTACVSGGGNPGTPNNPGTPSEPEAPTYGCSAGAGGTALGGLLLAGVGLVRGLRRRRVR